ncbi:unnamed protein product [Adineta steineri]|uniref:Receptor protein-tyrosine kinase n=1 Tax=Adineta steineri TaxID=433720 RepID=A0A818Y4W0_9BILA|nr:unnamed protein product [Adineta steineri]
MTWIKTLKNLTETGGRTVMLECQVQSLYPVTFNWYRYNNPLDRKSFLVDENLFRSSIRLKNLKESQAGFYTCEVSNGFQTLTSTGFVRVQNPDIDPIDLNDDLLPSIEFQPEIISTNEESIDKLKCEIYTGNICRSIIDSKYISVANLDQHDIEQNLADNMKLLTNECRQVLLPMICLFVYPLCDYNRKNIRSICRKSCFHFQKNACMIKSSNQQEQLYLSFQVSHSIPTCDSLPPSSDDISCVKIEQQRNVSSSSNTSSVIHHLLSPDSPLIIFLSIFLPIVFLGSLMLLLYYHCCHNRNNEIHTSSTITPMKKSSHLLNSIPTSSPFHSTVNIIQNHHNITSSSSSSTNTHLTNLHYRQPLLKSESIYRQTYLPSGGNSLGEISSTNIRFLQELGEGEFGQLYIGELINNSNKCMIKMLQNEKFKQDYLHEIEIFNQIHHVNISCLLGICIQSDDSFPLMIYEYSTNGDLHEYLILQDSKTIDLSDLLYISIQIVSGMIYLSEKNFLHNDLSTKNILISEQMNIKITNIARYRRKYHLDYYKIANRLLPVRWMSIESLLSGIYSEMSDVWSFGVLLWEMFSYGTQPYYGQTNPEVIEMIRDRKLLTCPMNCPKKIYTLMCLCWEEIIEQRPTFIELMRRLRQFEDKSTTTTSSIDDEFLSDNQIDESSTAKKHITLIPFSEQTASHSMLADRNNSIRIET